ncbi:MAG: hypothetical protein J5I90_10540 [Caldilineales bacterium]|nr:hypothetical protein [Caldilineales bacterium]
MFEFRIRTLLLLLLALIIAGSGYLTLRFRQFSAQPRPIAVIPAATATDPDLALPANLHDDSRQWQASWRVDPAAVQAALAARYPNLQRRFREGVELTILDAATAPEPLRGSYDPEPALLRMGAAWPEPGNGVLPLAEAWSDCYRDLELGPARSLRCYLYARGEPGPTLDGLAILAWVQAMDLALSGHTQPFDPAAIPFLTATPQDSTWTYSDAFLSLSLSPSPSS